MRAPPLFAASLLLLAPPRAFAASGDRDGEHPVTIVRDERGVPHVHADTLKALFYGVGYAQGQDRLWQAETLRRAATGTLAEWFGPGSVASDVQARLMLGPRSRRAALFDSASPGGKTVLESFAAGMNAWIAEATAAGSLPLEYTAFGVAPRPWTVDDTIAIDMLLGSQFGWFGSDELGNARAYADLVARLGPDQGARAFADSHFLEDPSAPTTDPGPAAAIPARARVEPVRLPDRVGEAAESYRSRSELAKKALDEIGIHRGHMSNAVLIGPRMSADGRPLLMGGPQMGHGAPQINHEMGL
ncbi:MAG TPA: penicillin acylase family protein, partial [Anaeromyxobacteraceae bacterium]|nr:penicillin acylase family protein [Anaeromyxobacteraceae bacterium]